MISKWLMDLSIWLVLVEICKRLGDILRRMDGLVVMEEGYEFVWSSRSVFVLLIALASVFVLRWLIRRVIK